MKPTYSSNRWLHLHSNILLQALLVVVPLLAFTAILLGLVYIYSWRRRRAPIEGLSLDSSYVSDTLYVDFSATRLILVASWSSSVAIPLIGQLCNLASYVVAADMVWSSKMSFHGLLPTPSQLAVLIDLLDAKKLALFIWFSDLWNRGNGVTPSRWVIEFPAMLQIFALVLSAAILGADTWLHVATSSVTMSFLSKIDDPASQGPMYLYSRNLTEDCFHSTRDACSVVLKADRNVTAYPDAIKDLMTDNTLSITRINQTADGTWFLAPRLPHNNGASSSLNYQTFSATTLGASARCHRNITTCGVTEQDGKIGNFAFACDGGMNGTLVYPDKWLAIGAQDQSTPNQSYWDAYWKWSSELTYVEYSIVAFLENYTISNSPQSPTFDFIPSSGQKVRGSIVAMTCDVDMFALAYDWTNVTERPLLKNPSLQTSSANAAFAVALVGYFNSADFDNDMKGKFRGLLDLPIAEPESVTQATVLSKFERAMGYTGLSMLGGTFEQTPATKLSLANSTIVTQVGKTPLFTLVILNLWYACFAVLLFALAVYILRDEATRRDIIEVQQLITVNGLATAAVKKQRSNLGRGEGDVRVGVEKVDGAWQFRVWEMNRLGEDKGLLGQDESPESPDIRRSY